MAAFGTHMVNVWVSKFNRNRSKKMLNFLLFEVCEMKAVEIVIESESDDEIN